MATTLAQQQVAVPAANHLPGRRFDHVFFPGVAWLMLIVVFIGFAPSYYLVGGIRAPLPSLAIHVHAVLFSSWILLLIAQTSLMAAGRVDVHRRLGIAGFILAGLMLIVGIWAATDALARDFEHMRDPLGFYILPLGRIVVFAVLMVFAYRARFDSAAHKRLIIVASTALMTAPIARWHFHNFLRGREFGLRAVAEELSFIFILLLIAYDLWATRRVHRATVWAGAFLIIFQQLTHYIGRTSVWHAFAGWVQTLARS
jgi:FtsH-binding integral membrane protein